MLVIEVVGFVVICVFRPYQSKWSNLLDGFLSLVRVVCVALLFTFMPSIHLNRIAVTAIGVVILVIQSVVVVILFIILIVQILRILLWLCCKRRKPAQRKRRSIAKRDAIMAVNEKPYNADTESNRPLSGTGNNSSQSDSLDSALRGASPRMSHREGYRRNVSSSYS